MELEETAMEGEEVVLVSDCECSYTTAPGEVWGEIVEAELGWCLRL